MKPDRAPRRIAILCISDPYMIRAGQLRDFYQKLGSEVLILTPDFSHRHKTRITAAEPGVRLIRHPAYRRNLSVSRLGGHWLFSKRCVPVLESFQPDLIHCLIPANSLVPRMKKYRNSHPECALIFDVIDLWPESLPVPKAEKIPGFTLWKQMRDRSLNAADLILTECGYYRGFLPESLPYAAHPLYWAAPDLAGNESASARPAADAPESASSSGTVELVYLGSMNNIFDLKSTVELLRQLSLRKPVRLHLIGSGENRDELCSQVRQLPGVELKDHGEVYEPEKKRAIFRQCAWGINLMKRDVRVGLSMKSIDYLENGLPLINSLSGDTWDFCERKNAGINLDASDISACAEAIAGISEEEYLKMSRNARKLYEEEFSTDAFEEHLYRALCDAGLLRDGASGF